MENPYNSLPGYAFWKSGVATSFPDISGIYEKKFSISKRTAIATAGSCFAQHIARNLKARGYNVLDAEPAPPSLPKKERQSFGFEMYSARYGNIYTVQQLLQLAKEAFGETQPELPVWSLNGRFYDPLRPGIEPCGQPSHDDVLLHREMHLEKVKALFLTMDLFVFTFGLTEHWYDSVSDLILPMAPGTIAGKFDDSRHHFRNATFNNVLDDFNAFQALLLKHRNQKSFRCLVTVSPVPLTATYQSRHVLVSTTESKAILRTAAGQLARNQPHIDYFPSYEIITNPAAHSMHYLSNLRSVAPDAVDRVMKAFFEQHSADGTAVDRSVKQEEQDIFVKCEEEILARFG